MLLDNSSSYFFFIGTLYLIILTWQDYKHKMTIDDRHNYFMMGIALSLMSHFKHNIWYILGLMAFTIIINIALKKSKSLGGADISTLSWVFWGLGYIGIRYLFTFLIFLTIATIFYGFMKTQVFKYKGQTPFYYVLLVSFWFNAFYFGLY